MDNKINIKTANISDLYGDTWNPVRSDYHLLEIIGEGSFGMVVRAKCRKTGEFVAIKLIEQAFENQYEARKLLREIKILRKFKEMASNIFVIKVKDVILPEGVVQQRH